jgi:hypothetical protein
VADHGGGGDLVEHVEADVVGCGRRRQDQVGLPRPDLVCAGICGEGFDALGALLDAPEPAAHRGGGRDGRHAQRQHVRQEWVSAEDDDPIRRLVAHVPGLGRGPILPAGGNSEDQHGCEHTGQAASASHTGQPNRHGSWYAPTLRRTMRA